MVPLPKSHHRYQLRAGVIGCIERPRGRGAEPEVPVETGGNRLGLLGSFEHEEDVLVRLGRLLGLASPGAADPDVHLVHRPDGAGLDQLDHPPVIVAGMDLRAHLGRDLGLGRRLADDPRLGDVVGQRLLAVDVLAELQGRQGGEGVGVLGRAHDHRVEPRSRRRTACGNRGTSWPWDTGPRPGCSPDRAHRTVPRCSPTSTC